MTKWKGTNGQTTNWACWSRTKHTSSSCQ